MSGQDWNLGLLPLNTLLVSPAQGEELGELGL